MIRWSVYFWACETLNLVGCNTSRPPSEKEQKLWELKDAYVLFYQFWLSFSRNFVLTPPCQSRFDYVFRARGGNLNRHSFRARSLHLGQCFAADRAQEPQWASCGIPLVANHWQYCDIWHWSLQILFWLPKKGVQVTSQNSSLIKADVIYKVRRYLHICPAWQKSHCIPWDQRQSIHPQWKTPRP